MNLDFSGQFCNQSFNKELCKNCSLYHECEYMNKSEQIFISSNDNKSNNRITSDEIKVFSKKLDNLSSKEIFFRLT